MKKIISIEKEKGKVRLVMFGGSVFLFPHPVKELSDFLKARDIIIGYDAAHVAGLIAGKKFQDPLREGADVMSMSTHKTFFGPQRGAIVSFEKYAEKIKKAVFPGVTSNHHLNTLAGLSIAALEILKFGKKYADDVIKTAKKLAEALYERGFDVVGEKKGFTESHQILVDVTKYGLGGDIERKLENAGIIVNRNLMPWDPQRGLHYENPGGIRLGVQELVRIGMGPSEMIDVARFFERAIIKEENPETIRREIADFRKDYQDVHYCFRSLKKAYEYLPINQ
jgi:glycine hydroxymethyltransferase